MCGGLPVFTEDHCVACSKVKVKQKNFERLVVVIEGGTDCGAVERG